MSAERRKHARVPLNLLVQFRSDDYAHFREKYAPNISTGGMFIETDHPRQLGSMVYFQFTVRDDGPLIEGLGTVVRVVDNPDGSTKGIGIEFVNLDDSSRAVIEGIIRGRAAD